MNQQQSESAPHESRAHPVLHGRLLSRAQALQLLFQAENSHQRLTDVLADDYVVTQGPADDFACFLAQTTFEKKDLLDAVLQSVSAHWDISRMALVDKNILRLALCELLYAEDLLAIAEAEALPIQGVTVDPEVAINEAVRLSKIFGGEQSFQFVNGLLGRIVRDSAKGTDFLQAAARELEEQNKTQAAACEMGEQSKDKNDSSCS